MELYAEWELGFRVDPRDHHPQSPNIAPPPPWCAPSIPSWWTPQSWVPPTTTSLWSFHPLGVLVLGVFSTFNTETSGFSHLFPGLQPHLLSLPCRLHLPVFQDYTLCAGEQGSPGSQDLRSPPPLWAHLVQLHSPSGLFSGRLRHQVFLPLLCFIRFGVA